MHEVIDTIRASIHTAHTSNIVAVADKLSGGVMHTKQLLLDGAHQWIKPGLDYFNCQLSSTGLFAFKAVQVLLLLRLHEMQPDASSVDFLSAFPFLAKDLQSLKTELPTYLPHAVDVDPSIDPLEWWKQHASSLPNWASDACKVLYSHPQPHQKVPPLLRA